MSIHYIIFSIPAWSGWLGGMAEEMVTSSPTCTSPSGIYGLLNWIRNSTWTEYFLVQLFLKLVLWFICLYFGYIYSGGTLVWRSITKERPLALSMTPSVVIRVIRGLDWWNYWWGLKEMNKYFSLGNTSLLLNGSNVIASATHCYTLG